MNYVDKMTESKKLNTTVVNDGILDTRNLILRLMCGVYLATFTSFYYQCPGYKLFHVLYAALLIQMTVCGFT